MKRTEEALGPNNTNIYKALSAIFWHLTSFLISDSETHGSQLLVFTSPVYGERGFKDWVVHCYMRCDTGRRLKQAEGTGRQERGRRETEEEDTWNAIFSHESQFSLGM